MVDKPRLVPSRSPLVNKSKNPVLLESTVMDRPKPAGNAYHIVHNNLGCN